MYNAYDYNHFNAISHHFDIYSDVYDYILICFYPYPNSTDCYTKHIAMLHGLWPS